jgi:O-antigen/teichoic acid export membrane protein
VSAAVARNALFLVAGQAATTALAIVFSAALGRSLGAADFGVFYLITTMSTFAYVCVEWGQPLFVIREAARDPPRSGELLGTALLLRAAFAVLVTVPAGLAAWGLGYGARTTWLAALWILATLPLVLAQGYGMVFRARDEMGREAAVSISNKALVLLLAIPLLGWGAGLFGVIAAQAAAGAAALGIAVRLHRRLGLPRLRFSPGTARELLAAGAPILAMTAAASVQPYLDAILLSKLAPAAVVGWFGAARNVLGTLMAPATILAAASYPRLARLSGDAAALRGQVRSAMRPLLWLGALAGAGTYLFADDAVSLIYGAQGFGPAATVLRFFAPGFLLLFVDILLGHVIYASGRGTGFAIAKLASVGVGTALNVVLIPWFQDHFGNGGIGVVVAFALSELVVFAGAVLVLREALEPGTALDAARAVAAAAVTILLFQRLPPIPSWAGLPLCVAVFAAASLAVGLVRRRDLVVLRALTWRRRAALSPAVEAAGP